MPGQRAPGRVLVSLWVFRRGLERIDRAVAAVNTDAGTKTRYSRSALLREGIALRLTELEDRYPVLKEKQ